MTPNDLWSRLKTIGFLYSTQCDTPNIPNMRSVQASLLEISCLQGFHNLTPVDPKWPLTSTKNNRVLVLNVVHLHTKYEICPSFPSWDIVFTRFLKCFHNLTPVDPKWPLTSTKTIGFLYSMWHSYIPNMRSVQASLLRYRVYKVFTIWPLLTPNDLWPPPKTIGFLYSMWCTYIPHMRSVQASMLEISCLQGFHNLTPVDP